MGTLGLYRDHLGALLIALVCVLALAAPAPAQGGCPLYAEAFDVFSGPADFDNGAYQVRWCRNGASVTATSPCLTGNSLRLNGASHDPVIALQLPAGHTCTMVTLEFRYAQAIDTGTIVRFRTSTNPAFACTDSITTSIGALTTTGGACITVQHQVPVSNERVLAWKIDHGNNTNAIFIDSVSLTLAGCPCDPPHGCCEAGAPGCDDPVVRDCVCAIDPFCCEVAWDEQCIALVDSLGCGQCSITPVCLSEFSATFGTFFQSGRVCATFPALFETCEGAGPSISNNNSCGGSGDYTMIFASGFPHSAAITKCLSLVGDAPAALTFNYTKNSGTLGPKVDIAVAGGGWVNLWTAPFSFPGGCRTVCLNLAPYIGQENIRLRFSSGTSSSSGAAFDDIQLRRDIACASHDPCTPGEPGTSDPAVTACMCAIDPYCCTTAWDDICVIIATLAGCTYCAGLCPTEWTENFGDLAGVPTGFSVCDLFPGSFTSCDPAALATISLSGPCAGPNEPAMVFPSVDSGMPPASVIATCVDLAQVSTASLRLSFSALPGGAGPRIEASEDLGATFVPIWAAPIASSAGCRRACIDLTPFAGRAALVLRFIAGSASAAGQSIDDLELVRGSACPNCSALLGDADGSGAVGLEDIALIIGQWGQGWSPPAPPLAGDVDRDGTVGLSDLAAVIAQWGQMCP